MVPSTSAQRPVVRGPGRRVIVRSATSLLLGAAPVTVAGCSGAARDHGRGAGSRPSDPGAQASSSGHPSSAGALHIRGGDAARRRQLASALPGALDRVQHLWGGPPVRGTVVVTTDAAQFAAAAGTSSPQVPAVTTGERIVLSPQVWHRTTTDGLQIVVTHELTHLRLPVPAGVRVKLWVTEGAAEVTAYLGRSLRRGEIAPGLRDQVARGRAPSGPPADAALDPARSNDIVSGYEQAWAWCEFLLATRGRPSFVWFVRAAHSTGSGSTDQLFRRAYGRSVASLSADYRTWLSASL